jgi:hypothetical protein
MITVCHPVDDLELLLLRARLEAAGLPYFVGGDGFGSLYPGMQIPAFNERRIQVPAGFVEQALEAVAQVRAAYTPSAARLSTGSRLRMLVEALWFGWIVPGGKRRAAADGAGAATDESGPRG